MDAPAVDNGLPELPNVIGLLARLFEGTAFSHFLHKWEFVIFSVFAMLLILIMVWLGSRKISLIPGRMQSLLELIVGGFDDFVQGILGPKGRRFTPFLGTIFIYILFMNLLGVIPFMKSGTASWSTTMALALCVFFYVQYTALREFGLFGYIDHLAGKPRGFMLLSVIFPVFFFFMEIVSELIRPFSLSLRLRSNIWGDDLLIAVLSGYGLPAVPVLFFNMMILLMSALIQAMVFCVLSAVYFALVLEHEE